MNNQLTETDAINLTPDELMTYTQKDLQAYYHEIGGEKVYFKNKTALVNAIVELHNLMMTELGGYDDAMEAIEEFLAENDQPINIIYPSTELPTEEVPVVPTILKDQKIRVDGELLGVWPKPNGEGYFKKTLIRDVHFVNPTFAWTELKFHRVELTKVEDGSWVILQLLSQPLTRRPS